MHSPKDPSYLAARAVRQGTLQLAPAELAITQSLSTLLDARVLHVTLALKSGKAFRQLVIAVAVETSAERARLGEPSSRQRVAASMRPALLHSEFALGGVLPELVVGFAALEDIELQVALTAIKPDLEALAKTQPERIWNVIANGGTQHTVFFHRESDVTEPHMSAVRADVLAALKKHDDFNLFGTHSLASLHFDSHERFEREYGGNFHLYFQ